MSKKTIKRICLWSGPRNVSTALMYSFAQREDCQVYDEPLYAHYLSSNDASEYHPGAVEIMQTMENDGQKVVNMMMGEHDQPVVFFKNMIHHIQGLDWTFMKSTVNVILTRDPKEMLPSFARVIAKPVMKDVGYAMHTKLMEFFKREQIDPVVLDAAYLLQNPEKVLKSLCEQAGIPFDQKMLNWKPGALPEDGIWARYWYASVHASTGFQKYKPKKEPFPRHLQPLLEACQPHYEKIRQKAIQAC